MRKFKGFQKGVNLGGWISQYDINTEEHFNTFITKADIERIAGWGLDHVRLPIDYEVIMEEDDSFKEKGFSYIDNAIKWCKECGLNIILDVHKTKGYMFDTNAVPDPDLFFKEKALQDSFITLWKEIAARYGKYSEFVAFELLNEVVNKDFTLVWNQISKRAITEIRKIAPDSFIIVGGTCYNSAACVQDLDAPYDGKIVYNFHCYEPLIFTHQSAYWVENMPSDFHISYPETVGEFRAAGENIGQATMGALYMDSIKSDDKGAVLFERLFESAVSYAEKMNVPLYCGEYGVIDQAPLPDTVRWFEDIHSVFEKYGIGRAVWNYKQKDFGIVDAHYADIADRLVENL